MKCRPGTVTSTWFGHVRQSSRAAPVSTALGSALTNSFGTGADDSHSPLSATTCTTSAGSPLIRKLSWPGERGTSRFSWRGEGLAIVRHLLLPHGAHHHRGYQVDEDVVGEHHLVAGWGPQRLEELSGRIEAAALPRDRLYERFHVGDALHRILVTVRPIGAEHGTPVVEDESHALAYANLFEELVEVAAVLHVGITVWPGVTQLGRVAHADEVPAR